jgi:HD-GYP domain-containing protein (c-di-GMP phosphodiesterase class II)
VEALLQVLAWSDDKTGAHSRRVQRYASELTRELAPALLEDPSLLPGFLLHDVGKIAIPDQVLQKPGPLAPEERALMQTHAVLGAQLLSGVSALEGAGLAVIRSHHERWDGEGYPDGLAGEEIPLAARIFAVADALDALTSDRPYRPAGSWNAALEVIAAEAGKQFDPAVVAALERIEGQLRTLCDEMGRSNGSLSLPVLHAVGAAAVPVRA